MTLPIEGPFSLHDEEAYAKWRDYKRARFPVNVDALKVEVKDLSRPSDVEIKAIGDRIRRSGMAIYQSKVVSNVEEAKILVRRFGENFGLKHLDRNPYADDDAISHLHDASQGAGKLYIPYTTRALNWHTDGYYNPQHRLIRSMILHCVEPATCGGENFMFDPEMAYILMREADLCMLKALFKDDAMTIPTNDVDEKIERHDINGPVFSVSHGINELHMRYTARRRHVKWAKDAHTSKAVDFLSTMLGENSTVPDFKFSYHLNPGEGLVCRNVLHGRTAFENMKNDDNQGHRMMLRARYLDPIDVSL